MALLITLCPLVLLPLLAEVIAAQGGCDSKQMMSSYLHCLKGELDRNYGGFEEEIKSHNRRAAGSCFSQTLSDANQHDRCVLAVPDLDAKAWDRNGPLRDCSICRTFAAGAIKAVLSTPAEDQKCIRTKISRAIALEAEHCLGRKIPNFAGLPEIPDLEEGSYKYREEERARTTRDCLKTPFPGYLQKHCSSLASCDQQVTADGACQSVLKNTKAATCACIDEARDDLKRRIAGISDSIHEVVFGGGRGVPSISDSRVDACVAAIKKQLITPVNDWASVIDTALSSCIKNKPSGQSLGIDSLLNVGCRKIIADTTGTASGQLKTGFDFINNLIDGMVERSRRFCGGPHCGI